MLCPTCGGETSVVETRDLRRRRACTQGHRFSTVEITVEAARDAEKLRRKAAAFNQLRRKVESIDKLLAWVDR